MAEKYHIIHNEGEELNSILKAEGEFDKAQEDIEALKQRLEKRAGEGGELDNKIDRVNEVLDDKIDSTNKEINDKVDLIKVETDAKIPDNLANGGEEGSIKSNNDSAIVAGRFSFAFGTEAFAIADYAHAEGKKVTAEGGFSHAEGLAARAAGYASHAEGSYTFAEGDSSHAEGGSSKAAGNYSHAEGESSQASGIGSHAEGGNGRAIGNYSHAESGYAEGAYSHAEGSSSTYEYYSHAEGDNTEAYGRASHSEGSETVATKNYSHAEGHKTHAAEEASHAEGYNTNAGAPYSHAEGSNTDAKGEASHVEGYGTTAAQEGAHAEGYETIADGMGSHAEGYKTHSTLSGAHAEGWNTYAGESAHAEGRDTEAVGRFSHAEGLGTKTTPLNEGEHVQGRYNIADDDDAIYAHIVGNGTSDTERSNAHTLDWSGNAWYKGGITTDKIEPTSDNELVTKYYVDNKNVISYTYAELKELKEAGGLKKGQAYLINDFQSIYKDPYEKTDDVGINENTYIAEIEPLVIVASTENSFFEKVYSISNPAHEIFYHFEKDKVVKYALDWATNHKGMIIRRIDEQGNDLPYDFVNMRFRGHDVDLNDVADYVSGVEYKVGDLVEVNENIYIAIKKGKLGNPRMPQKNEWIFIMWGGQGIPSGNFSSNSSIKLPETKSVIIYDRETQKNITVKIPIDKTKVYWTYTFNDKYLENAYKYARNTKVFIHEVMRYGLNGSESGAYFPRFFNVSEAGKGHIDNNYFENSRCIINAQIRGCSFIDSDMIIVGNSVKDTKIFGGEGVFSSNYAKNVSIINSNPSSSLIGYSRLLTYIDCSKIFDVSLNNSTRAPRAIYLKGKSGGIISNVNIKRFGYYTGSNDFVQEDNLIDIICYNMENITIEGGSYHLRFEGNDLKNLKFPYIDNTKAGWPIIEIDEKFADKNNTVTFYQNEEGNLIATEYIGDTLKEYMGFRLVQPKIYGVRVNENASTESITTETSLYFSDTPIESDNVFPLIKEKPTESNADIFFFPGGENYFNWGEGPALKAGDTIRFNLTLMNFIEAEEDLGEEGEVAPISFMLFAHNGVNFTQFDSQVPIDKSGEEYNLEFSYTLTTKDAETIDGKDLQVDSLSITNAKFGFSEGEELKNLNLCLFITKSSITISQNECACAYIGEALEKLPGASWEEEEPFKNINYCTFKDGKVNYYLNKENLYFKDGLIYQYENGELVILEYTDKMILTEGKEYLEFSEFYRIERVDKYLKDIKNVVFSLEEAKTLVQNNNERIYSQEGNCIVYYNEETSEIIIEDAGKDFCFVCNDFYEYSYTTGHAIKIAMPSKIMSSEDFYIINSSSKETGAINYVFSNTQSEEFNTLIEQYFNVDSGAFIINGEIYTWNKESKAFIKLPITATLNGADGDVMIEIPKIGYRLSRNKEGYLDVEITTAKDAEDLGFCYFAHEDSEKIYIGTYLSSLSDNELKSIDRAGNIPLTGLSIEHFRKLAQSKGEGYGLVNFNVITLLQSLYLLYYCSRNSQEVLGKGRVNGNLELGMQPSSTGSTSAVGGLMVQGADTNSSIRCMGLEDFWGNAYWFVDGIKTEEALIPNTNRFSLITSKNCSNIPINYTNKGIVGENNLNYSSIKKVQGTNEKGFLPKEGTNVSDETYWTDGCSLNSNSGAAFIGGCKTSADDFDSAGIFNLRLEIDEHEARPTIGARLMYR